MVERRGKQAIRVICQLSSDSKRWTPFQARKAGVITIDGDPLASLFDRQSGEPGILNQVAGRLGTVAESREDLPVTDSRLNRLALLGRHHTLTKMQNLLQGVRLRKYAGVSANPHDRTQHLGRDGVSGFAVHNRKKPIAVFLVFRRVVAECVDKNIDVRRNQRRPSIRSRSAAELLRSTPGKVPPPTLETGKSIGSRVCRFCVFASTSRSPCSIRPVRVSRRSAASRFACRRRASSSRTVVLICLDIPKRMSVCQL